MQRLPGFIMLRKQQGSVLINVIIVLALIVILGISLLDQATLGFRTSKHDEAAELAYIGAEAAIEKCFAFIDHYCSEQSNTVGIDYLDEEDFAKKVISSRIMPKLTEYTSTKFGTASTNPIFQISLSGMPEDKATVEINHIQYLGWREYLGDTGRIIVTIGITAIADYIGKSDKASNKKIFSKMDVVMFIPRGFKLEAAVYSIGDLMVDNINAQITGDVVAFGTSPKLSKQVQQFYYGGIYVKNGGHLSVRGNAYSRGLIRTGEYNNSTLDTSSIYIFKDAIANGVQIFGNNEKIVVGRNAYTFDDLELNGEDSVIAVNGSYIGLSNDLLARHHDQSSALVNSAVVHYESSDNSLKSRVVINGDVIINGGTFHIDPFTGQTDPSFPQIEDASVLLRNNVFSPLYRDYIDSSFGNGKTYHQWLLEERGTASGFSNLIQRWNPLTLTDDAGIKAWTDLIDSAKGIGANDSSRFHNQSNILPISGFCHYEIGANDRVYFMEEKEISKLNFIVKDFMLDNIPGRRSLDDWKDFWKGLPVSQDDWVLAKTESPMSKKLSQLRNLLLPKTEVFCKRNYDYSGQGDSTIQDSLRQSYKQSSENLFVEIGDKINSKYPETPMESFITEKSYIFNFSSRPSNQPIDLCNEIKQRGEYYLTEGAINDEEEFKNKYFLFYNPNPTIELKINGNIRGIIYSMGKVILEPGADVTGSILAAGNGYISNDGKGHIQLPQILGEGDNLSDLDNGNYSGVYFKGNGDVQTAKVYFPGREALFSEFLDKENIELYSIFDF